MSKTREQLKVTQERLPGSQMGLEIEISAERSRTAYEQTVTNLMKSAQIPGFRRGKIPRQVVLQRFGAQYLKAATLEDLLEKTFQEAVDQEQLSVLGNFQLRSSFDELVAQFEPGTAITYAASVDVPPEATLKRYTEFEITAEEVPYDEAEVERVINEQRSARATLIPVEGRSAQAGDVVQIDFSGQYFLDGDRENPQEVEGGSATDFQLELTEGQFIAGFTEGIVGMNPDETKEIEVQFPADYPVEELKDKAAVFTVTLKEIKTKELPELDDSFAQEVSEFETLAELRQFLEERYRKEAQDKTDANVEDALIAALVAELEVDLPETLISNEVNFLINQMAQRFQAQGIDVNKLFTAETIPSLKERFRDEAAQRVKRTLALAQVAKVENLTVLPEAIETRFQEIVTQLNDRNIDRARLKEVLEDELLQEKVIEWLKERSQISLVEKIEPVVDAQSATVEAKTETVETEDDSNAATKAEPASKTAAEEPSEAKAEEKKKTTRRSRTTKSKAGENKDEA